MHVTCMACPVSTLSWMEIFNLLLSRAVFIFLRKKTCSPTQQETCKWTGLADLRLRIEHPMYPRKMSSAAASMVFQRVVLIMFVASSNIGSFVEIVESASGRPREAVVRPTFSHLRPFPEEIMPLRHSIRSKAAMQKRRDQEDSGSAAKTRHEFERQRFSTSMMSASPSNVTER